MRRRGWTQEAFQSGWLIPAYLRSRWTLVQGDAKQELPRVLQRLGSIDFFLHDSLHTYENMMFEYKLAWQYLKKSGMLLSDDVNEYWTLAFLDFCRFHALPYCVINDRLGIARR